MSYPRHPKAYPPVYERLVKTFASQKQIIVPYESFALATRQRNTFYAYRRALSYQIDALQAKMFMKGTDDVLRQELKRERQAYSDLYALAMTYQAEAVMQLPPKEGFDLIFTCRAELPAMQAIEKALDNLGAEINEALVSLDTAPPVARDPMDILNITTSSDQPIDISKLYNTDDK